MSEDKNKDSNFQKFLQCKSESNDLAQTLNDAAAVAKNQSFDKTIDATISKLAECRTLGDVVKKEASTVNYGKDIIYAIDITQNRILLSEKILTQTKTSLSPLRNENAESAKELAALQTAQSFVRMSEEMTWSKLSRTLNNNDTVGTSTLYNGAIILFVAIFCIIFIINKKKKV